MRRCLRARVFIKEIFFRPYSDWGHFNSFSKRTNSCGELRKSNVGEEVWLKGWIKHLRNYIFVMNDSYGCIQVIVDKQDESQQRLFKNLNHESVVEVKGVVTERPELQRNQKMETGDIEIHAKELKVLGTCISNLPVISRVQNFLETSEATRLKYRYLDLRGGSLLHNLRTRSTFMMKSREFLCFVDVETPTLFRATPGGAREFVVPTHEPGEFFSLTQSPQQFKQLLMIGGLDRYMQFARCYRDESVRPDRQPEFTQLDLEMSFSGKEEIMSLVESLLQYSWPESKGEVFAPFRRMKYDEAMETYGTDKPDISFGSMPTDVEPIFRTYNSDFITRKLEHDHVIKAVKFSKAMECLSKTNVSKLISDVKKTPELWCSAVNIDPSGRFPAKLHELLGNQAVTHLTNALELEPMDLLLLVLGPKQQACVAAGELRISVANKLEEKGKSVRSNGFHFLWVEDFPLFTKDHSGSLQTTHHPFTAPAEGQEDLVRTAPEKVVGQHYDLVLNGAEVGGGSIRINNRQLQEYILREVLQLETDTMEHLLFALECGCPPHGGIALGIDRLMAIICGERSVRNVIAFPKSHSGKDYMTKAPCDIPHQDKLYYHLLPKSSPVT